MGNDCEICGEGFITEQVDFIAGVPLFYVSCSYCKCDYATQKHITINNAAKKSYCVKNGLKFGPIA